VVVAGGSGHVVLELVQPAGRAVMSALDWWNGLASTLDSVSLDSVRFD
jgi:methionyl-tRNA formyltransferase